MAAKIPDIRSSRSYTDAAILLWCYNHDNQLRHRHEAIITSNIRYDLYCSVGKYIVSAWYNNINKRIQYIVGSSTIFVAARA